MPVWVQAQGRLQTIVHRHDVGQVVRLTRHADASGDLRIVGGEVVVGEREVGELGVVQWVRSSGPGFSQAAAGEGSRSESCGR